MELYGYTSCFSMVVSCIIFYAALAPAGVYEQAGLAIAHRNLHDHNLRTPHVSWKKFVINVPVSAS